MKKLLLVCLAIGLSLSGLYAQKPGDEYHGKASFYHKKFNFRNTSSGEIFHNDNYVAAHRTLPFGSLVEITNLSNQRAVIVRINDRGPHTRNRVVDLSQAAAKDIGMIGAGVADVKIKVLMIPRSDGSYESQTSEMLVPKVELKTFAPIQIDSSGGYFKIKTDSVRVGN